MIKIFGLEISDRPLNEIIARILKCKGFSFIVTPNLQHIVELNRKTDDLQCYRNAEITLCDSKIVSLASKLLGKNISHVIPGSDLTKYLFDYVLKEDSSIMVVGSTPKEISVLRAKYNLKSLKHYNPPYGFINDEAEVQKTIDIVNAAKPKYLFLAVGFPRQEQLACKLKATADYNCVAFCVGASIDFITGKQKRAPQIWQTLHLEWLHRFLHDPKRLFKRYFVDSWGFIPIFFSEFRK